VLNQIEMEFATVEADTRTKSGAASETMGAAMSAVPILGGAWAGYRQAGLKGAAVGAAGTYGTAYAAGIVAALIGFPITLPVIAILGVLSAFSGGWLTKLVFGSEVIANFKASYKEGVSAAIDKQLRDARVSQKVYAQITNLFEMLKNKVRSDVESLLDDTQRTLTDLDSQFQRDDLIAEHKRQELENMSNEANRMLSNAQRMSEQLLQEVNV
jgi:hypothetical protein